MTTTRWLCVAVMVAVLGGCGDDDDDGGARPDSGSSGVDASTLPDGATPPPTDGGGGTTDACVPMIEICGDRIDQNCNGRDQACGDNDGDGIEACRAGDDLTRCDCDDSRADVYPPFNGLPGAPELCDGVDNDCNGRIDESAECCDGCASLDNRRRADWCNLDGVCDCSTAPGVGPCSAGQTCCAVGCVDTQTSFDHCGACNTRCTTGADRCVGGDCRCGANAACDFVYTCSSGSCN